MVKILLFYGYTSKGTVQIINPYAYTFRLSQELIPIVSNSFEFFLHTRQTLLFLVR
jgi:hypothetical protein